MSTCGECRLYRPENLSSADFGSVVISARATLDALDNTPLVNREARLIISQYNRGTLQVGFSCISDEPTVPSCRLCLAPDNFTPRRSML
jgi:hypothetical protein